MRCFYDVLGNQGINLENQENIQDQIKNIIQIEIDELDLNKVYLMKHLNIYKELLEMYIKKLNSLKNSYLIKYNLLYRTESLSSANSYNLINQ